METWYGYQGYTGLLEPVLNGGGLAASGPGVQAPATQGCQGPYENGVQGTGGFGADCCPCPCCPPPCCSSAVVEFTCGSQGVQGCTDPIVKEDGVTFIVKEDGVTFIGQEAAVSLAVITLSIVPASYQQGGQGGGDQGGQGPQSTGICCIEYNGGTFRAVGNGYVDFSGSLPPAIGTCNAFHVEINGYTPPVFVTDGTVLTVTVTSDDPLCCPCSQTNTSDPCNPSMAFRMAAIMKNDRIILDRKKVVQKVAAVRRQKLQQKMRVLKSLPT